MPFPLAHPAAVLPFRRFCPRFLCFPALVAGSLSPDVGYLCQGDLVSDISHSVVGGTMFGFVVGLMITFLAYGLGPILASRFRESATLRHLASKAGLDRATLPRWSMTTLVFSLLIGVWTHLFFDSFTHTDGLLVKHVGFLQSEVTKIGTHSVRICHLLWYACSFAGVAILVLAFRDWQASTGFHSSIRSGRRRLVEALVVPLFILPIELGHHFVHTRLALLLVIVLTLAVVIAFMLGSARARQIENPVEGRKTGVQ